MAALSHDLLTAFVRVWSDSQRADALQRRVDALERLVDAIVPDLTIATCTVCGDALLIECKGTYAGGREVRCEMCKTYFCRTHLEGLGGCRDCGVAWLCVDCRPASRCVCILKCGSCRAFYAANRYTGCPECAERRGDSPPRVRGPRADSEDDALPAESIVSDES